MNKIFDVTIIGGGIIGLATAYSLATKAKINILLLEAEPNLAAHQTGNNSGVIHSGLYYKPGSLKAKNCVEGRESLYKFCENHDIQHERCGKVVVATNEGEITALDNLEQRGKKNGLKGLRRLSAEELKEYEPSVSGVAGLLVPETGIVNYTEVCEQLARITREHGHQILTDTRFLKLQKSNNSLIIETDIQNYKSHNLINCAGLQSDRIAKLCGLNPGLKIVPFRGEYYKLKPDSYGLVRNLIYPVPDPKFPFLGVHFTRMIDNSVEAGPNAVLSFKREGYQRTSFSLRDTIETFTYPGFLKLAATYARIGLGEFYRSFYKPAFVRALQKLIPEISEEDIIPGGAGVRAQALESDGLLVDDFRIVENKQQIHVLNAPSPAATACLSIGKFIAEKALTNFDLKKIKKNE
jgi:L-2-hydroxyglutarate oxidase